MNPVVAKYRKFAFAGYACALISLFIGGALLAVIGFILSHTAYRKLKSVVQENPEDKLAASTQRIAKMAFMFCGAAAVLNFVTAATLLPQIMGQTGLGAGSAATSAATGGIF